MIRLFISGYSKDNFMFTLHFESLNLLNVCSSNVTTDDLSLGNVKGPYLTSDIFIPLQVISFVTVL